MVSRYRVHISLSEDALAARKTQMMASIEICDMTMHYFVIAPTRFVLCSIATSIALSFSSLVIKWAYTL